MFFSSPINIQWKSQYFPLYILILLELPNLLYKWKDSYLFLNWDVVVLLISDDANRSIFKSGVCGKVCNRITSLDRHLPKCQYNQKIQNINQPLIYFSKHETCQFSKKIQFDFTLTNQNRLLLIRNLTSPNKFKRAHKTGKKQYQGIKLIIAYVKLLVNKTLSTV